MDGARLGVGQCSGALWGVSESGPSTKAAQQRTQSKTWRRMKRAKHRRSGIVVGTTIKKALAREGGVSAMMSLLTELQVIWVGAVLQR